MSKIEKGDAIKRSEQKYVEDYLKGKKDEPQWMTWVLKKKRDKIQDRLLVVGNYWVVSIKRNKMGKKSVQREGHMLRVKKLSVDDAGRNGVITWPDFHIECESAKLEEMMTTIRKAIQKTSCGLPDHIPKLKGPDSFFPELEPLEYGIAAGLFDAYEAWCNYFQCKPSADFKRHVEDLVLAGSEELDLTKCPGIEPKMEYSFQLEPILNALAYNTYFRSFIVRNVPRKEVLPLFANTLETNTHITRVVLAGVDSGPEGYQLIGDAFKKNPGNILCEIDFSNNRMGEKGVAAFSSGIISLQHGIACLNLSNNGIPPKGIATLLAAVQGNSQLSATIRELDMSGNKFEQSGSQSFADWATNLKNESSLEFLNLSNASLDVHTVMTALRLGVVNTLTHLDISHNKMERNGAQSLALLVENSQCLTSLNISSCKLSGEAVENLLSAFAKNHDLTEVKVDLSDNDIGSAGADNIARGIAGNNRIHTLNLRDTRLKAEGVKRVVEACTENKSLRCLDLSLNAKDGPQIKETTTSLCTLVKQHPALETLIVSGDGKNNAYGKSIVKLLKALAENTTLTELDVGGNKIGDQAAIKICEGLRVNKGLTYVAWDSNGINMGGMQALRSCLANSNKTLVEVPNPKIDIERAIAASRDGARVREKFAETSAEVLALLKQNKTAAGTEHHSNLRKASETRPPPTGPPSFAVREHKEKEPKKKKKSKDKKKGKSKDKDSDETKDNESPSGIGSGSSTLRFAPPPSLLTPPAIGSPPPAVSSPPAIRSPPPTLSTPPPPGQSGQGTVRGPVYNPPPTSAAAKSGGTLGRSGGAAPVFKPGGSTLTKKPSTITPASGVATSPTMERRPTTAAPPVAPPPIAPPPATNGNSDGDDDDDDDDGGGYEGFGVGKGGAKAAEGMAPPPPPPREEDEDEGMYGYG